MKNPETLDNNAPKLPFIAALVLLTFFTYSNSLWGDFIWDDQLQVLRNAQIRDLSNIPQAFTGSILGFVQGFERSNYYRPLHTIGYMVAYAIGGLSTWPYHLLNLALHITATVFLYLLCCEMRLGSFASILAALIFAVHPIHTEVVDWIAALPEAGCGAFYLMSVWAYLRHIKSGKRVWLGVSACGFLVALFWKEMAITLPAVILALAVFQGRIFRRRAGDVVKELAPYAIVVAGYLAIRMKVLGYIVTTHTAIQASTWDWLSLGINAFGQYIRYSLAPYPLSAFHLIPTHFSNRVAATLLYGSLIVLVAGTVFLARKRVPTMPLWLLLFALMIAPVFNFKGISGTFFAERYLYIPSFAIAIAVALALDRLNRWPKFILSGFLIVLFTIMTFQRNEDWKDNESLYAATLQVQPEAVTFRINLAELQLANNRNTEAKRHIEQALADLQDSVYYHRPKEDSRAYESLGFIAANSGDVAGGKTYLQKGLEIDPNSARGLAYWEEF